MINKRPLSILAGLTVCVLAGACTKQDTESGNAGDPAADAAAAVQPVTMPARTPSPAGARVFFITPAAGDTVPNPVRVEFGIEGMSVAPAGIQKEHSGHHHLLVDTDLPPLDLPIPADAQHIHFGDGSTWTELTLAPGEHTLQLLLADHAHFPHDPPVMSPPITITVK